MPVEMLLDRSDLLQKLDQIGLVLSALFIVFLPLEVWRRHRQGRLDRRSVKEMLPVRVRCCRRCSRGRWCLRSSPGSTRRRTV